jgi:hypothetical protein
MALQKTTQTRFGISVPNAYHRVELLTLESKEVMRFNLRSYASVDLPPFDEASFEAPFDINGANPIKQAYEYLKALREFDGAEDV